MGEEEGLATCTRGFLQIAKREKTKRKGHVRNTFTRKKKLLRKRKEGYRPSKPQ